MPRALIALGALTLVLLSAAWRRPASAPLGFSAARAADQRDLEHEFLRLPSADRIRDAHRVFTARPHLAGTPRDRELAEWTRDRFRDAGLTEVAITTHDVLLPWPDEVSVEMETPGGRWRAAMHEAPIADDPDTLTPRDRLAIPYHAYSRSGEVTAPAVFAGSGSEADYDWMTAQGIDVRGRIVIVRHSVPYSYRGAKVMAAERRGAAGLLIYSDPADEGEARGPVYPHGPWAPPTHVQRGGIAYDFLVPGDPLTPGWASTEGAPRVSVSASPVLPRILSAPLSAQDARVILASMTGADVPSTWAGSLPIAYRSGPTATTVTLRVRTDERVRPVWTVTGMIKGRERPDDVVIVGNHRDAWMYGGVDPSSGSATLVELARTLGTMSRRGWAPKRSILFASWDAEEFSLISSTEWGEQHQAWLGRSAVAYLNVDHAGSGSTFSATAVPALNGVIAEAASLVRDPATGLTLAARARDQLSAAHRRRADIVNNRIGGGSDYSVFLNFLGVPIADLSFTGPYGVYHSVYDTHRWVATIGDPGFRYQTAMAQTLGLLAIKIASADVVPLDYEPYAARIDEFAVEISRRWMAHRASSPAEPFADVRHAAASMRTAAIEFNARRERALQGPDTAAIEALDAQLLSVERALLDPGGLPGRSWYRHAIYAPHPTYAPELLPGLAEAAAAGDDPRARAQAQRLAAVLRRAAAALSPR